MSNARFNVHRIKHDEDMHTQHCNKCTFASTSNSRFQDHMRRHEGVLDIPCAQCERMFVTLRAMRNHVKRVHAPKVQCPDCPYKVGEMTKLRVHMKLVHSPLKVKSYKCFPCDFTCTQSGNCRKHILQRHPNQDVKVVKLTKEELAE